MSTINDGGAAFPRDEIHDQYARTGAARCRHLHAEEGMTLRDYFAAKAMQAFIARGNTDFTDSEYDEGISRWAYEVADGMLRVRGQQ